MRGLWRQIIIRGVSILVFLDLALRVNTYVTNIVGNLFQSLFSWILLSEIDLEGNVIAFFVVSILVFLDLALRD